MAELDEWHVSAKFRDVMRRLVLRTVDTLIPPDEFGEVTSVDAVNGNVQLIVVGTPDPVTVNVAGGLPAIGDIVRITGRAGSRFVVGTANGTIAVGASEKIVVPETLLFTSLPPSALFSWTEVDIGCSRMFVTKFETTAASVESYAVLVYGGPNGTEEQMYGAAGFPTAVNSITWPWWFENQADEEKMYIGIRNDDESVVSDFSLTELRGERLA